MRYSINLATRTCLDHRLLNRLGYCSIVVLLIIAGWDVSQVASNMGEQSRLNAEIGASQSKLGSKPGGITEADLSHQKARIRFYNEIIERKSMDWLTLLELFENATPEGIALVSLSADKERKDWKLEGLAKTFKSVQLYLEKLEASKNFSHVLLLSHLNVVSVDKERGVKFTISCRVVN